MTAKQIRALRRSMGLTQSAFAAVIPTTVTTVSRWERGERSPRGLYLSRLKRLGRRRAKLLAAIKRAQARTPIQ